MNNYEETKKLLNSLLENNKDEKQLKIIAEAQASLAAAEEEHGALLKSHDDFVLEYGKLVRRVGTKVPPVGDESNSTKPLTLEDIIRDVTSKSKEE